MATEVVKTGKIYRILADETNKLWHKISFWSKASDTEFNDGKNAETKLGAISGITDSLSATSSNVAASAKAVNTLNSNFAYDANGDICGYYKKSEGADTVYPFKSDLIYQYGTVYCAINGTTTVKYNVAKKPVFIFAHVGKLAFTNPNKPNNIVDSSPSWWARDAIGKDQALWIQENGGTIVSVGDELVTLKNNQHYETNVVSYVIAFD